MITSTTIYLTALGLALSLLPLWIGYRRKIGNAPMIVIMAVSGLIPYVGLFAGLYIALRAEPNVRVPVKSSEEQQNSP